MLFLGRLARWWGDRSRAIFVYHDGARRRRADPVAVGAALEAAEPEYLALLAEVNQPPAALPPGPVRAELAARQRAAAARLVAMARKAFGLAQLSDAGGVTDGEALGVLTNYFLFMEDLADEARPFATSPPPG